MNNKDTITAALGIPESWESKNEADLLELLKNSELLSDAIIAHAQRVKMEEFDLTELSEKDITLYEKKLIWSGMELAKLIYRNREQHGSPLIDFLKMMSEISKQPSQEDEKRTRRSKPLDDDSGSGN